MQLSIETYNPKHCPSCAGDPVVDNEDYDNGHVLMNMICPSCEFRWTEQYILTNVWKDN